MRNKTRTLINHHLHPTCIGLSSPVYKTGWEVEGSEDIGMEETKLGQKTGKKKLGDHTWQILWAKPEHYITSTHTLLTRSHISIHT